MAIWLATIFAADGFDWLDGVMLAAFLITAPWFVIGFWNSAIGFAILQFARDPNKLILPAAVKARDDDPIFTRTAVLVTVRNEDRNAPSGACARSRRASMRPATAISSITSC